MNYPRALSSVALVASLQLLPHGRPGTLAAQGLSGRDDPSAQTCAFVRPKGGQLPRVVIYHRALDHEAVCSVRLARGDQVLVEVVDANELIYEYTLANVAIPAEAPPPLFAAFLSATFAPVKAGLRPERFDTVPDHQAERHADLAERLRQAATGVRAALVSSDVSPVNTQADADSLHARLVRDMRRVVQTAAVGIGALGPSDTLTALWNWAAALKDSIVGGPADTATKGRVARAHAELAVLYPEAAQLARQLADLHVGLIRVWSNDTTGSTLVRITVKPKLSADYSPARLTTGSGGGVNLLRVRPPTPKFQASVGLGFTPFDARTTYSARTKGDTTFFDSRPRDLLAPVPTTFFSWQPWTPGDFAFGVGAGVGIRIGSGELQLKDALDYSLFLTAGYSWFRVHVGAVWAMEVDESKLPATDATGTRTTSSNRALDQYPARRHPYLFIGIGYTP